MRSWRTLENHALLAVITTAAAAGVMDCDSVRHPVAPTSAAMVSSNAAREDYAGSSTCAGCHAAIHGSWQRSPMRRMTRSLPTDVRGRFDGSEIHVGLDVAVVEERGGARFVRVKRMNTADELYRVTRAIGGRYREDYVGLEVTGASDPSAREATGREVILPVSYMLPTESWRYKGYSVLVRERDRISVGPVWSEACVGCHNTVPQVLMLLDDLAGPGAPSFQGSITDDLLPPDRAFHVKITSESALRELVQEELGPLGVSRRPAPEVPLHDVLVAGIRDVAKLLDGSHLVEEGVGCEACHGGSAAHVANPSVLPRYDVATSSFEVGRADAKFTEVEAINRGCARCHSVLFSRYPATWEGGSRRDPVPGGSSMNSGEARDFLLGGCASALTCTTCHDPHGAAPPGSLKRFDRPEANGVCTACHEHLEEPTSLRAHTHHAPEGAGSACLGCHMPRKNMGLGYELTRYHRIGSPTDEARVYGDRPLECAVCHADASAGALLDAMSEWWGRSFDRARVAALYANDLVSPVLQTTLRIGKPHEQAVAIGVLGERARRSDACGVAEHLAHEYPLVRFYAHHALERITGAKVDIDPGAPATTLAPKTKIWCEEDRRLLPPP